MLLVHYYALAFAGALLTGAWLFLPKARLQVTTLSSLLVWFLLALLGGQTETIAQNETVRNVSNTTLAVSSPEFVAAPVPTEFRYFAAFLGLLSAFALILGVWGAYPPEEETDV